MRQSYSFERTCWFIFALSLAAMFGAPLAVSMVAGMLRPHSLFVP